MKILIDDTNLKLVLTEHANDIGSNEIDGIDSVIAGIGFILTIFFANFSKYRWMKTILIILGIMYLLWGTAKIYKSIKNRKFNKDILYNLIEEKNEMEKHPHSIVLIKDNFNQYPNRFLVYYDNRWKCKLFINYHTMSDDENNIQNITNHLKMELKVDSCEGCYLFEKVHDKFSVTANRQKSYIHRFYKFNIETNETIKKDSFTIDGKHYYWMSIAEMENDSDIMKYNSDIVNYVKQGYQ